MDSLDGLNERQKEAVTCPPGYTLVLAGPGSGKTRVLTYRIAFLIHALNVEPYRINAVTFTNKAARVMKDRLEKLLGSTFEGMWIGTFHSICARILRREAEALPFSSNFVIFDADDQKSIVKAGLKELNLDEKLYNPNSIHNAISHAKNQLILPEDYSINSYRDEVIIRIYEKYQKTLLASNALDFDDLLMWTVKLFEQNPDIRQRYSRRFEHILVDEFQDTNMAQYDLIKQLSAHHKNLFVVGDEDQSIYRWRGADYRNVLRFEEDFPEYQKIVLEKNYRSGQNVLDAAFNVIEKNKNRTTKNLFTDRGTGEKITLFHAADDHAEARYVAETIQTLMQNGGTSGQEIAVMYRTNAQSRLLEDAFMRMGMAYRIVGAQRFYGRREIKDMIAYLRLVHNPSDDVSLRRIINVPPRKIGNKTVSNLQEYASKWNISMGNILLDLVDHGEQSNYYGDFSPRELNCLLPFAKKLHKWQEEQLIMGLPELLDAMLKDIAFEEFLADGSDEGETRWENVLELQRLADEFQHRGMDLADFLENLALVSDQDTIPEKYDSPTLLTLHAAKGLEYDMVFIVGLDEGVLPHNRSINSGDAEEMAEERRLFYVGITRTKKKLFITRANQRTTYGSFNMNIESRFLEDIPEDLIEEFGVMQEDYVTSNIRSQRYGGHTTQRWESRSYAPKSKPVEQEKKYKANMRVRNENWGEGVILESKIEDGDEIVDVHFESVGFKRLIASLAKLEIIK